jgi:type II secretory pathway predicted ATPase ExeA
MYRTEWQLQRSPFAIAPEASQVYPALAHTEALARIDYLVKQRRRVGALLGDVGLGKSTVLASAARQLTRAGAQVARVDAVALSPREALWQTNVQLGAAPRDDDDFPRLWRRLCDRLAENRWQNLATVLLFDDAGQAGPDLVQQFARLARLEFDPAARWTIVLAAQASQLDRWPATLLHAIDLRIDLYPWSEDDTIDYVQQSLVGAGCIAPIFTDDALVKLHELTRGNPRLIVRLAEHALRSASHDDADRIDAELVAAAFAASNSTWHALDGTPTGSFV